MEGWQQWHMLGKNEQGR